MWQRGPAFDRALAGRPVASFDVAQLAEWQRQPEAILQIYGSALHAPLQAGPLLALLVLVHPARAFFDARHVSLVRRLLPAASILCVPVIGFVDEERCAHLMERLLAAVKARRARAVVIDVTGLDRMEASALALFLRVAVAVRLLGSACVLTGIGPEVARDLAREGAEWSVIVTYRRLHDALRNLLPSAPR